MSSHDVLITITMLLALGLIAGGIYQIAGAGYAMLADGLILLVLGLAAIRGVRNKVSE